MDIIGSSNNRKGRPNSPADFEERLAKQACEPGVSVSKLARQHGINVNMLFKWRRDLHTSLLTVSGSQSVHLLPMVVPRAATIPDLSCTFEHHSVSTLIETVIADAVVRISAGTDAALLQLVLQSLRL